MSTIDNCKTCLQICSCCKAKKCIICKPFGSKFDLRIRRCESKSRFSIGDHVRIRDDLVVGDKYKMDNEQTRECIFVYGGMSGLIGKYVTIVDYLPDMNRYIVSYNGVDNGWYWVDEMFDGNVYLPF